MAHANRNTAHDLMSKLGHGPTYHPTNVFDHRQDEMEVVSHSITTSPDESPFDIFRALHLLATRPNQRITLDAIHMSRPFVITDAQSPDENVIFVSDSWLALTKYNREEILGANCRLLQSPTGVVQAGAPRDYIKSTSAYELRRKIATGEEIQHTIINFKKGGEGFMNMLTIIPIPWDTRDTRFVFGFPTDVSSISVPANFQLDDVTMNSMARHLDLLDSIPAMASLISEQNLTDPSSPHFYPDVMDFIDDAQALRYRGQAEQHDNSSELLTRLVSGSSGAMVDSNNSERSRMILENTDGLVQVLSLKGTIAYISSSASDRYLGYPSAQLMGTSIEAICHPSDVVTALRDLKNAPSGSTIEMMFRLRRRDGQYVRFQNYGTSWNSGSRKWVVLIGYPQPAVALSKRSLGQSIGQGERDMWVKVSLSGLILHIFPNPQTALGIKAKDLVGTSFGNLIKDSNEREQFQSHLRAVQMDDVATMTLRLQSARGHNLPTQIAVHPGEINGSGGRPYSLLVQCRVLRFSAKDNGIVSHTTSNSDSKVLAHSQPGDSNQHYLLLFHPQELDVDDGTNDNSHDDKNENGGGESLQLECHRLSQQNQALARQLHELQRLSKQRRRFRSKGETFRGCANCHTRVSPEWRRGPSGDRDLCNGCGLRWAKMVVSTEISQQRDVPSECEQRVSQASGGYNKKVTYCSLPRTLTRIDMRFHQAKEE
ncbi:hypothetical protein BX600DRAFT_50700 [Xylariales sp. PMI_506]|nr:hypothetical protein BX600DRAFT_50700 [Xylariales sp. PMI_506]